MENTSCYFYVRLCLVNKSRDVVLIPLDFVNSIIMIIKLHNATYKRVIYLI